MMANQIHNKFASLMMDVRHHGDKFTISDNCLENLGNILNELITSEDAATFYSNRKLIASCQYISKKLIPILINVKDDDFNNTPNDGSKILDKTIEILINLMMPIENYLLPTHNTLSSSSSSSLDIRWRTIFELNKSLINSKKIFIDANITKAIMDHIKYLIERNAQINLEQCYNIHNCLLLIRNILHVPDAAATTKTPSVFNSSLQNQIIWNLFTQSIDKVMIYLMTCSQKTYWGVTLVQLIALLYKDQHTGTLHTLLNLWLETSLSESSEDNESNTSPPDQGTDCFSPIITSDPTSDSSDTCDNSKTSNNTAVPVHKNCNNNITDRNDCKGNEVIGVAEFSNETPGIIEKFAETQINSISANNAKSSSSSRNNYFDPKTDKFEKNFNEKCEIMSDCGYVTQIENHESISTSSNEEEQSHSKLIHQKIRYSSVKIRSKSVLDQKELRRKKLVKRSKTNTAKIKGILHHLPTNEDIANILKEFIVDFLLKGYGPLVQTLHFQLLTNLHIDSTHFFWLLSYFLKFATQLELDLEHISSILSFDIFSYLIFQGIWIFEEIEFNYFKLSEEGLKLCLRRLHLTVTAIKEFFHTVEAYQKMIHLSEYDRINLIKLQQQIGQCKDLQLMFLLLLRKYNQTIYNNKQYLQDLIVTNHNYLLFLDRLCRDEKQQTTNIMEYLKHFGTPEIMGQYGLLLESFENNGEFVNNCIFTMMHHVGGDLDDVATLFQPNILKTFSKILEIDYEICDDWSDLIEYVFHEFISSQKMKYYLNSQNEVMVLSEFAPESKHHLQGSNEALEDIRKTYERTGGMKYKTRLSIIQQLLKENIISEDQFNNFMRIKQPDDDTLLVVNEICEKVNQINLSTAQEIGSCVDEEIKVLLEFLHKNNGGKIILWLQRILLETCYVKLVLNNPLTVKCRENNAMEPIVYYYTLLNLPVPLVPWTTEQNTILQYQPVTLLLHKLGFDLLTLQTRNAFVRIPNFWNSEYIFKIAQQLGPIAIDQLKFDINLFSNNKTNIEEDITEGENTCKRKTVSVINYLEQITLSSAPLPSQLSDTVPRSQLISSHLSTSELTMADCSEASSHGSKEYFHINDDNDHMKYEASSAGSDLTRMCVSDEEEDNVIFVMDK